MNKYLLSFQLQTTVIKGLMEEERIQKVQNNYCYGNGERYFWLLKDKTNETYWGEKRERKAYSWSKDKKKTRIV